MIRANPRNRRLRRRRSLTSRALRHDLTQNKPPPDSQCGGEVVFSLFSKEAAVTGNETKSVGIWLRVSTEDQVKGESPEHHEARARGYATAKGWHVAEVYRLDAVSGKAVLQHPEAQRMLADIRSGAITGLVFSKLARLARSTKELLEFADVFRECDTDMVSLSESIDTSSPAGRRGGAGGAAGARGGRGGGAGRGGAAGPI